MKVVNIVLCILILVLALVSAVFSYFLFEKRDTLVKGWEKMAVAVNNSSAAMDVNSGTREAAKLTKEELSHEKYASLDSKLSVLVSQSRRIVSQRDALAQELYKLGVKTGMSKDEVKVEDITNVASSEEAVKKVDSAVSTFIRRSDEIKKGVSDISRKHFQTEHASDTRKLTVREMNRNGYGALKPLDNIARQERSRGNTFKRGFINIGRKVGVSTDDGDYSFVACQDTVSRIGQGVDRISRELRTAQLKLVETLSAKESAEKNLWESKRNIDRLNAEVAKLKDDFKRLTTVSHDESPLWDDGSPEVRARVEGKVTRVDKKYGYIVIDLTTKTTITQKVGNKELKVNPKIAKGLEMIVIRGNLSDEEVKYIARIKIDSVDESCATANIPAEVKDIRVGDTVCFEKK